MMSNGIYDFLTYRLGMGRFPDSLGTLAKKVKDAMQRFKKCASDRLQVGICITIHSF